MGNGGFPLLQMKDRFHDSPPLTRACFDRYREIFAEPYPYDSYDQAFVPELESGAVENPGCVTFRDDFLFPAAVTRPNGSCEPW